MRGKPRWQDTAGDTAQQDHLRFALALHEQLAEDGRNSCFSPFSVAGALSLVAAGARGDTARELVELLAGSGAGLPGHARLLTDAARLPTRDDRQDPILEVANTLWAWDGLALQQSFRDEITSWPSGGVRSVPFVDDPDGARQAINADVAERTRELIPELIPPGGVDADTVASLVNALYLRVAWVNQFEASATVDDEFHTCDGTVRVPMMAQTEQLAYCARDGWQAVGLPAVGGVQAVVLLPDGSLADQELELDVRTLTSLLGGMANQSVDFRLPRLRLDEHVDMASPLGDIGVRTLFTAKGELTGISPDARLFISSVLHQAVLRVDESGIEGAAATAAMMKLVSMTADPTTVRVNRPFLLLVRHVETGAVYFFARVTRP